MTAIERPGPAGPSVPPDEQMVFVPGGTWLQPLTVVTARMVRFSAEITF